MITKNNFIKKMQGGLTGIILRYSGHQKIFYIDTFLKPSEYTLMYRMPSGKIIAPDPFKVPIAMDADAGELQPVPQKINWIHSIIIYITNKIQNLAMYSWDARKYKNKKQ